MGLPRQTDTAALRVLRITELLFGNVLDGFSNKEIADALSAQHGISIPKTKIVQDEPIKAFGGYTLKVKLGYEVTGTLKVVVAEN